MNKNSNKTDKDKLDLRSRQLDPEHPNYWKSRKGNNIKKSNKTIKK